MEELFKKNPIARRHCLLYIFLHEKSIDELFDDFCETVGKNVIKKKTFLYWFNQFEKEKFDAKKEPMDNIVDILRNDKKALRVCVIYELHNAENTRSKDPYLENEALSVFAKYQNFCKAIGDEVMEYQEFDFWFYRFANGMFDLKFFFNFRIHFLN